MPTIPIGNAGFAVPRPQPTQVPVPQPGWGAGTIAVGEAGMAVASDMLTQERRTQQVEMLEQRRALDEQERERRNEERQAAAEARAFERERKRVAAGTAATQFELDATQARTELDEQMRTGELAPERYGMELTVRLAEAKDRAMQGVDPEFHQGLAGALLRPERMALLDANKSVTTFLKERAVATLDQAREGLQRLFVQDPQRAATRAAALFDDEYARVLGPKEANALKQRFMETGWREHFTTLAGRMQNDRGGLTQLLQTVSTNEAMDPTQKAALVQSINGRLSTLEIRAQGAADRQLRRAEQAFKSVETMMAQGIPPTPEFATQTAAQLKGTPFEGAFRAMVEGGAETARFGALSVDAQRREMQRIYAERSKGSTPAIEAKLSKLERIHEATKAGYASDPWMEGAKRGQLDQVPPMRFETIGSLAASLQDRLRQAPVLDAAVGETVSPFQPEEAHSFADFLGKLPPAERARSLNEVGRIVGPARAAAIAKQIDPKDRPLALALRYTGAETTADRFTSELILKGAQARTDGTSTKGEKQPDVKLSRWQAAATEAIGGAFANQRTRDDARDAAVLIMHGIMAEQGALDSKDMQRAVRLAVGGDVVEHAGGKVVLPAGIDEAAFRRRLASVRPEELGGRFVNAGGVSVPAADFAKALPEQQLVAVRPGEYVPMVRGRAVLNERGAPVVVRVRP